MAFPTRISRYIFGELITPTMMGLFVYTFVLLMNLFFLVAEKSLSKHLGWELTLKLFLVGIPRLLVLTIPMAVLFGVMIAVGRLSADNEWTAMQGAGQSPRRLLWPVALFGMVAALASAAIYAYLVPEVNFVRRNLRGQVIVASNLASDLQPRVFYTSIPNSVLYVDDIRPDSDRQLQGVILVMSPPGESTKLFLAKEGNLYAAPDGSPKLIIDLFDGVMHFYDVDSPETYRRSSFVSQSQPIPMAEYLEALIDPPEKVVRDFSPQELFSELKTARSAMAIATDRYSSPELARRHRSEMFVMQHRINTVLLEVQDRLALPLACLFFALLALPLGVTRARSGKGAGFALSLIVIMVYWAVYTLGRSQALQGNIPIILGPWLGNLVIAPWALIAYLRISRPESDRRGPIAWLFAGIRGLSRAVVRRLQRAQVTEPDEQQNDQGAPLADLSGTPQRFVRRLDQYVGKVYLRLVLYAMASFYLITILIEFKSVMDSMLRNDQPFQLVLNYFKYFPPGVLHLVLPISCLVGAVISFSLLERTGELTAMKACGINMRRATYPVLLLTVIAATLLYFVDDKISPTFNRNAREIKDQIGRRSPRTYGGLGGGNWSFGPEGRKLFHYRVYDQDREVFKELSAFTFDRSQPRIIDHRYTERARWVDGTWEIEGGWYRSFPDNNLPPAYKLNPGKRHISLIPPEDLINEKLNMMSLSNVSESMSREDLKAEIARLAERGYDLTRLKVDLHAKWAHAFSPVVMVLLGLPFAFKVGRKGSLYGIGVALVLVLVYWATFATFNALGLVNILDPFVAAWAPNILFMLIGSYLMLYIKT
jgi:LPS export ABC transporter permease LptG/LPS export ABC transporter permease LptF